MHRIAQNSLSDRGAPPDVRPGRSAPTRLPLWFRGLARLLCVGTLGALEAGPVRAAEGIGLKVMSFNILEDRGTPSSSNPNAWGYTAGEPRRDRAVRVIVDEAPDIAGLQEVETNQVADITGTNALSAYAWFGAGRDDGLTLGQHELILYRTNRFTRTEAGVFWLSLAPDTPGSQYPGAAKVRIAVWVRLLDRHSGRTFLVFNTHWDYASAEARLHSARLIRARIDALASNSLALATGDLNMTPDDPAYAVLLGTNVPPDWPFRDAYRQAIPAEQPDELTRHDFTGATLGKRIDYVFHADPVAAVTGAIVRTSYGGRHPSDHYPVTAALSVAPVRPAILAAAAEPAGVALTWSSVSGLPYRVRFTTDPAAWPEAHPPSGAVTASGPETRCTVPVSDGEPRIYYRVVYGPP